MIDAFFLLTVAAMGFGLSLATYRLCAVRNNWPMGHLHVERPIVPIAIGLLSLAVGVVFAAARAEFGGWVIMTLGILLAIFWTGFVRVGSQLSLILAPAAATLLVIGFLGAPVPGNFNVTPAGYSQRAPQPINPSANIFRRNPN